MAADLNELIKLCERCFNLIRARSSLARNRHETDWKFRATTVALQRKIPSHKNARYQRRQKSSLFLQPKDRRHLQEKFSPEFLVIQFT
jgi:hypothetical protein